MGKAMADQFFWNPEHIEGERFNADFPVQQEKVHQRSQSLWRPLPACKPIDLPGAEGIEARDEFTQSG